MLEEHISWSSVLSTISEKTGKSKAEICRQAGLGGGAASIIISSARHTDPRYSEGLEILRMFSEATNGEEPPTTKRKAEMMCVCCQTNYEVGLLYRISENSYRCKNCILRAGRENNKKHMKTRRKPKTTKASPNTGVVNIFNLTPSEKVAI